jgi:integrase
VGQQATSLAVVCACTRSPMRSGYACCPRLRTWLLALGVHPRIVMEIVGHSAMEMTMNVDEHVNLDAQHHALDQLDDQLA